MAITNIHSPFLESNHVAHAGDCFSLRFDVDDVGAAHTSIKMIDSDSNVYGCTGGDVIGGQVLTICNDIAGCLGGGEYVPNIDIDELSIDVHDADYNFLGNYNLYPGVTAFSYVGTSSSQTYTYTSGDTGLAALIIIATIILLFATLTNLWRT